MVFVDLTLGCSVTAADVLCTGVYLYLFTDIKGCVLFCRCVQFCQLTRDGEVYHDYCLNYSKAMTYLEQLRKNDEFVEFEKVDPSLLKNL